MVTMGVISSKMIVAYAIMIPAATVTWICHAVIDAYQ